MLRGIVGGVFGWLCLVSAWAQMPEPRHVYPKNDFAPPLQIPLELTGNFCTLRENHFHSGLDFRTGEKEGLPVLAAANGFISRVKISPFGYGKAIYIDHPNGYTTVYGHLSELNGPIALAILKEQYQKENFDLDFFPGKNRYMVKQGDTIAWSGNSGGSSGPHLHFEIRHTSSEEIINPLFFGLTVMDTMPPVIKGFATYHWDQGRYYRSNWVPEFNDSDTLVLAPGKITFSAHMIDPFIYAELGFQPTAIGIMAGNDTLFMSFFERFHFDQTKQINGCIDYDLYWNKGVRFQKLWHQSGITIPFFRKHQDGSIWLKPGDTASISFFACDWAGHFTRRMLWIRAEGIAVFPDAMYNREGFPVTQMTSMNHSDSNSYRLHIPAGAVADTTWVNVSSLGNHRWEWKGALAPYFKPVKFSVRIDDTLMWRNKQVLCFLSDKGKLGAVGGTLEGHWLTASILRNGTYVLSQDLKKPTVKPLNIDKKNRAKGGELWFDVRDDLSGIGSYKITIDGKWVLGDYDAKSNKLSWKRDKLMSPAKGWHIVEVVIKDKVGNVGIYKKKVFI